MPGALPWFLPRNKTAVAYIMYVLELRIILVMLNGGMDGCVLCTDVHGQEKGSRGPNLCWRLSWRGAGKPLITF